MKRWLNVLALAAAAASAGCESTPSSAPPITAAMVQSGSGQHFDSATLTTGRSLYVSRCARCHALPAVGEQSPADWPGIVAAMSKRSGLKVDQSKAVLAYLLAAGAP